MKQDIFWRLFSCSHHTVGISALKAPGKAHSKIALNKVGIGLLPYSASPGLHHMIVPLIQALTHTHTQDQNIVFALLNKKGHCKGGIVTRFQR